VSGTTLGYKTYIRRFRYPAASNGFCTFCEWILLPIMNIFKFLSAQQISVFHILSRLFDAFMVVKNMFNFFFDAGDWPTPLPFTHSESILFQIDFVNCMVYCSFAICML
jgi:hypothetical protein